MSDAERFIGAIDVSSATEMVCDVAIFGSGVAGLSVACALPEEMRILVFSKGPYSDGSTQYAQGGIAAAIGKDDHPALHAADTLAAAAGIADPVAVATLTNEAPAAITFLQDLGTRFDRIADCLALTLEGGHSRNRIVHAGGDATGAEVSRALFTQTASRHIPVVNEAFLVDLLLDDDGVAAGAIVLVRDEVCIVRSAHLVLASGGAGQLFASTTSPATCTGDGMAVAYRAGAELCDMEFMQFHPTVMVSKNDPRPLISEALRGEGAVLRDAGGQLVMEGQHPQLDLAPRDVVARAMVNLMQQQRVDRLFLDATGIAAKMQVRFPTISSSLREIGLDPATDMIPVSPAAHYSIGGVRTSIDGVTSIDRLYGVGEVASVGIHGANRLASNSLLEGVVFGRRIAQHIAASPAAPTSLRKILLPPVQTAQPQPPRRDRVRDEMDRFVGVIRDRVGLVRMLEMLKDRPRRSVPADQVSIESANMELLSELVVRSSLAREESRGAHYRSDVPDAVPEWSLRQVIRRGDDAPAISSLTFEAAHQ